MGATVGHVEVLSDDPAPLREFYSAVFGWKVGPVATDDPEQMEYAMVEIEDGEGALTAGIGKRGAGFLPVTFYLRVDDLQATLDSVAARGGRTVTQPLKVGPVTTIARFADPAGNVLGLVKD
jgi:predicted enzyme related to lactoylglutathione lyase